METTIIPFTAYGVLSCLPLRLSAAGLADADAVADGLAAAVVGLAEADDVVEEDGVADVAFVTVGELEAAGELVAAVGLDVRPASGGVTAHPPNASARASAPINRALEIPVTTNEGTRRPEPGRHQLTIPLAGRDRLNLTLPDQGRGARRAAP